MSEQLLHFHKRLVGDSYMMNEKFLFFLILTPLTCSSRLLVNVVNNSTLQRISLYHRLIRRTQLRLINSHKMVHSSGLKSRYEKKSDSRQPTLASSSCARSRILRKSYYQSNYDAASTYFTIQRMTLLSMHISDIIRINK